MADTFAATGLTPQQWDDEFFKEYLGNHPFKPYMGRGENSIFQVKEDLSKKKGDSLTFALLNKLTQGPTTGSSVLEGNEEDMTSRSFRLFIDKRRHAVRVSEMEEQKSAIGLRNAAKPLLRDWADRQDINRIISELGAFNGVAYDASNNTQRSAWLVDNADRVLFGAAKSNAVSLNFDTALATIDNSADKFTPAAISLMREIAITANPKIRPIRIEGMNKRFYVAFANPRAFRDLKTNATITQAQREVTLANQNNKLFQGGDLEWDGVIIHEVDDMPFYSNGSIEVGQVFLCGAQALGLAIGKRWRSVEKTFDYDDKHGVAIDCIDGLKKLIFGSGAGDTDDTKDHGVVTGYFAAVASA